MSYRTENDNNHGEVRKFSFHHDCHCSYTWNAIEIVFWRHVFLLHNEIYSSTPIMNNIFEIQIIVLNISKIQSTYF